MKLVLGSRGSDLALAQSHYTADRLRALPAAPEVEVRVIKTRGDQIQSVPLASIGGNTSDERKGFFTKEIEDALLAGDIDLAVHSYKDLPTLDIPGLCVAAIPQRVMQEDVLVFPERHRAYQEPPFLRAGSAVGTSSMRRIAQVQLHWPDISCVPIRGNVPTRLEKARLGRTRELDAPTPDGGEREIHGILLARAGLERLRERGLFEKGGAYPGLLDGLAIETLPLELFPTAPAQGALAIQCRAVDTQTRELVEQLHNADVSPGVVLERKILAELEGGCHLPLGASARRHDDGISVRVFLGAEAEDNRSGESRELLRQGSDPETLAAQVVREIRSSLPIVLVGRKERVAEVAAKSERVLPLGLIETRRLPPGAEQLAELRAALTGDTAPIIAVFSQPGIAAFQETMRELSADDPVFRPDLERIEWAVTGERTAAAVADCFAGARVSYRSPDGTSGSLAGLIPSGRTIIALAAQYGRTEFFDGLPSGSECLHLKLYETHGRAPSEDELKTLPSPCYVVFGSPSAVDAFFVPDTREGVDQLYGALGRTTATRLREQGRSVYMVASEPDYAAVVRELL